MALKFRARSRRVHVSAAPAGIPMRSIPALETLLIASGDHSLTRRCAEQLATWEALRATPPATLKGKLPATPPALHQLPASVYRIPWYASQFPRVADTEKTTKPVLIYQRGRHRPNDRPIVTIGGAEDPSPQGIEVARSAALAAVAEGATIVVEARPGAAAAALRAALAANGKIVLVLPVGMDLAGQYGQHIDDVTSSGGVVLTSVPPTVPADPTAAAALATMLADVAVIAETGREQGAGADFTAGAVAAGLKLLAPDSRYKHTPDSALGLRLLTEPGAFDPSWYGENSHIAERLSNGLSAADAVVFTQKEIGKYLSSME